MKKLLLILLFFMSLTEVRAQDRIITIRKDTIECRIISVGGERIYYEQKTSENFLIGKSIDLDEVFQYYRTEQPGVQNSSYLRNTRRQIPEHRYLLTIQGGLARSFSDFDNFRNVMTGSGVPASDIDSYIGKQKNGYHINAGFHYLLTSSLGFGAGYTLFYSASEGSFLMAGYGLSNIPLYVNMDLNEKIYTHFAGPSVLLRQVPDRKRKMHIIENLSPGVILFRNESRNNEYQIYNNNYDYNGMPMHYYDNANAVSSSTAFGVKAGLSLEYYVLPQLTAGVAGNYIWGKLNKLSVKGMDYVNEDQKLEKSINVSHIDYGFTFRFNF